MCFGNFRFFLELFRGFIVDFQFCSEAYVVTMSSQDKVKKGQRKVFSVAILWQNGMIITTALSVGMI